MTQTLYPGLLERNPNLLFLLKCRQFVEMVSGNDSDVRPAAHSPRSSPNVSPTHSYSATSVGSVGSSSSSTANGFVSNGIDNGYDVDVPMDVEDFDDCASHGVLNGTATIDDCEHSPSRGDFLLIDPFIQRHAKVSISVFSQERLSINAHTL